MNQHKQVPRRHTNLSRLFYIVALAIACLAAAESASSTESQFNPAVVELRKLTGLQQILQELKDTRVVFVGENHDRLDHHQIQLQVLKAMHAQTPDMAIGVEWFQAPFQAHLNDYLDGAIDLAEMLERTEYYTRWRFDYRLYQPIIDYALEHKIPIVALNASRELIKKVSEVEIKDVDEPLKSELPDSYDWSDKVYEERLRKLFDVHPEASGNFDAFMRVQLTWDESMAQHATEYLYKHPNQRMLIFAGSGHIMYGSGIPKRLARRLDSTQASILGSSADGSIEPDAADFLVLTKQLKLPAGGLIGAFLDSTEDGVIIKDFAHSSPAKDAGMEKGDLIVTIAHEPAPTFAHLKLILQNYLPGDIITVTYKRDGSPTDSADQIAYITLR